MTDAIDPRQFVGARIPWAELVAMRPGLTAVQYAHLVDVPLQRAVHGLRHCVQRKRLRLERRGMRRLYWPIYRGEK